MRQGWSEEEEMKLLLRRACTCWRYQLVQIGMTSRMMWLGTERRKELHWLEDVSLMSMIGNVVKTN